MLSRLRVVLPPPCEVGAFLLFVVTLAREGASGTGFACAATPFLRRQKGSKDRLKGLRPLRIPLAEGSYLFASVVG